MSASVSQSSLFSDSELTGRVSCGDCPIGGCGSASACVSTRQGMTRPQLGEWDDNALCRDTRESLWFPDDGVPERLAGALCAGCPVRAECPTQGSGFIGVWGGEYTSQRKATSGS